MENSPLSQKEAKKSSTKRTIIIIVVVIFFFAIVSFALSRFRKENFPSSNPLSSSTSTVQPFSPEEKKSDVLEEEGGGEPLDEDQILASEYIKSHISELSPEKEVLGGKFYVTQIRFEEGNRALVEYEDGHIALRARVRFMVDGGKNVEVLEWTMLSTK